jgi:hypothetical protein
VVFFVLVQESPAISSLSPEVNISVEVNTNPFLDLLLFRRSLHEDVVPTNVVLRTPSPLLLVKKMKIVVKILNIYYFL